MSDIREILALVERCAPKFMRAGGGALEGEGHRPAPDAAQRAEFLALAHQGLTQKQIGEKTGWSASAVGKVLRDAGFVSPRTLAARQTRSRVVALLSAGHSSQEIAQQVPTALSNIIRILNEERAK